MRGAGQVEKKPIPAPAGPIARLAPCQQNILRHARSILHFSKDSAMSLRTRKLGPTQRPVARFPRNGVSMRRSPLPLPAGLLQMTTQRAKAQTPKTRCVACRSSQTPPLTAETSVCVLCLGANNFLSTVIELLQHRHVSSNMCVAQTLTVAFFGRNLRCASACRLAVGARSPVGEIRR